LWSSLQWNVLCPHVGRPVGRSVKLLLSLASTVFLGFESHWDPWPYFCFQDSYMFWNGASSSMIGGVWQLLVTRLLLGMARVGTQSLTDPRLHTHTQSTQSTSGCFLSLQSIFFPLGKRPIFRTILNCQSTGNRYFFVFWWPQFQISVRRLSILIEVFVPFLSVSSPNQGLFRKLGHGQFFPKFSPTHYSQIILTFGTIYSELFQTILNKPLINKINR
jgi:hypothetical protein